jgi:hypothetical protein
MGKRKWFGLVVLLFAFAATAGGPGAVRKQVEASVLVTGTIGVDSKGEVFERAIDQPEKLPNGVVQFIERAMGHWQFSPPVLDGQPVNIRNKMNILVVAKKQEDGNYLLRMQAVSFEPLTKDEGYELASKDMAPPRYLMQAASAGATGTVYMLIKVGRDGKVQEAMAEQVNLKFVASERQMEQARKLFADASLAAAKRWQFVPPSRGEQASAEFWSVRVPVDYFMHDMSMPKYGRWVAYVPGPKQRAGWLDEEFTGSSPEAMLPGQPRLVGKQSLQLLTPLAHES